MKRKTFLMGAGLCFIMLLTSHAYSQQMPSNTCGSRVPAAIFKAQRGIGAGVKDFPFELKFEVVSYTFIVDTDEDLIVENVVGNMFSGRVRQVIDTHVKPGKTVTIENVRVKGPDGRISTVPSLLYYII